MVKIGCRACRSVRSVEMSKKLKLALLAAVLVVGLGLAWDVSCQPHNQLTARAYIGCVRVYQGVGRPLLEGRIACRYRPTCSDYSIEAVRRFGTLRGLAMTYKRLRSCTNSVPMGTIDKVPTS